MQWMPGSNFKYFSTSFVLFGTTLLAFNLFHWSQPSSVLADIEPYGNRNIASIGTTATPSPSMDKILNYDCSNPQPLSTAKSEVRIALSNCVEMTNTSRIFNEQNHFQATLFTEKETLITDYIPLLENTNTISLEGKANILHKIVVVRTRHDAR